MAPLDVARAWATDTLRQATALLCPNRPHGSEWDEVGDDLRQAMQDYPLSEVARDAEQRRAAS